MSTGSDQKGISQLQAIGLGGSLTLLGIHFYYYSYDYFINIGRCSDITDQLLENIARTGLFANTYRSKLLALSLLMLSILVTQGRKDGTSSWQRCAWLIMLGIGMYFGNSFLIDRVGAGLSGMYIAVTLLGYILILRGLVQLRRILPSKFGKRDPFGGQNAGFPQEEKKREGPFSINLPAYYQIKGQRRRSWINIINGRRGVLVIGLPGCGKSRYVIEPVLEQVIAKGMAALILDLKYPALTGQAYHLFQHHYHNYPPGTCFYSINFSDLSRTHRCNLLEPSTLIYLSDAMGISRTILLSINKSWVNRQGDFFVESPINLLGAIIWFLRKYQNGRYCTLPHVIELLQIQYTQLFSILRLEPEIAALINAFIKAFEQGARDQLEGQVASAKIALARLSSPDLYYILSGDDLSLAINDPAAPAVFCLGGDLIRQEALAPVLSLYVDRVCQLINRPGRHPCALICDEFATIRAYSMITTIATARSNDIMSVLAIQDLSQLRKNYSKDESDAFMNISGNLICGQVGGDTARWVSERFPRLWADRTTVSTNTSDTSFSHSNQWDQAMTPATIATLSSGEFVGIVADDPGHPTELKAFHAQLQREETGIPTDGPIPVLRVVDKTAVAKTYTGIRQDIEMMVKGELARMMSDEELQGLIIQ